MRLTMSPKYLPTLTRNLSLFHLLFLFIFIGISVTTNAQSIFENSITGSNPSNNNPYSTGQIVSTGMSSTGISYGSGLGNANANDRFNTDGFSTSGTLNIGNNDFISWILTPSTCFEIDLTSLVIAYQRSGQGPQNLALRSSLDNYAANIWSVSNIQSGEQISTISLSGVAYQNLTSAITFRLYGWNSGNTNGTFSINNFTFNGAVVSLNTAVAGTISGNSSLCVSGSSILSLSGYNGNIQWQSSADNTAFSSIAGATSATYTTPNITTTTYYRVSLTAGGCPAVFSSSYAVSVNPQINPTFTQVSSICSGATLNALPTTSNNSITGTWSPALNNTATTTYTFTPTAGQCASTTTMTVVVNALPTAAITAASATTFCQGG